MDPVKTPESGYELCYECDGQRICWSCRGRGRRENVGQRCNTCAGQGRCIVCNGAGELTAGTKAALDNAPRRLAIKVGCFRELGFETLLSLDYARERRSAEHTADVVRYLRSGRILVMSPGFARDIYDHSVVAGSRSMRTDGDFVWPDVLAHYVERYAVELPEIFEARMAAADWKLPEVDIVGLGIK